MDVIANEQPAGAEHAHRPDKDITLEIQTTRGTGTFTFPHNTKVKDVVDFAVSKFGFASEGAVFTLVLASAPGQALDPQRTLQSLHIADATVVILTAVGTGV